MLVIISPSRVIPKTSSTIGIPAVTSSSCMSNCTSVCPLEYSRGLVCCCPVLVVACKRSLFTKAGVVCPVTGSGAIASCFATSCL